MYCDYPCGWLVYVLWVIRFPHYRLPICSWVSRVMGLPSQGFSTCLIFLLEFHPLANKFQFSGAGSSLSPSSVGYTTYILCKPQHIDRMNNERLTKQIREYNPRGRRSVGRPRSRCINSEHASMPNPWSEEEEDLYIVIHNQY
jgi:hypothetical protein